MNDDEWLGPSTLGTSTLMAARLKDALERAQKAEAERDEARDDAMRSTAAAAQQAGRAEKAEAWLAELVREMRRWLDYWRDMRLVGNEPTHALLALLAKYDGGEHEPPTLTEIYAAQELAAEAARVCCGEFATGSDEHGDEGGEHG